MVRFAWRRKGCGFLLVLMALMILLTIPAVLSDIARGMLGFSFLSASDEIWIKERVLFRPYPDTVIFEGAFHALASEAIEDIGLAREVFEADLHHDMIKHGIRDADITYEIIDTLWDVGLEFDINPWVLAAIACTESSYNPNVIGGAGEIGIMQVLPSTADFIAESKGMQEYTLWDLETNIRFGAAYLSDMLRVFEDYERYQLLLALTAYNRGPTSVLEEVETGEWCNGYAPRVMRNYNRIRGGEV